MSLLIVFIFFENTSSKTKLITILVINNFVPYIIICLILIQFDFSFIIIDWRGQTSSLRPLRIYVQLRSRSPSSLRYLPSFRSPSEMLLLPEVFRDLILLAAAHARQASFSRASVRWNLKFLQYFFNEKIHPTSKIIAMYFTKEILEEQY